MYISEAVEDGVLIMSVRAWSTEAGSLADGEHSAGEWAGQNVTISLNILHWKENQVLYLFMTVVCSEVWRVSEHSSSCILRVARAVQDQCLVIESQHWPRTPGPGPELSIPHHMTHTTPPIGHQFSVQSKVFILKWSNKKCKCNQGSGGCVDQDELLISEFRQL